MEIQTLLNFFTTNGFGAPTAFILIFLSILKLRPITFITATGFERKLFSKEANALFKLYHYLGVCLLLTFSQLGLSPLFFYFFEFNLNFGFSFLLIMIIIYLLISNKTILHFLSEKIINEKIKNMTLKYSEQLLATFILMILISFVYFLGNTIILSLSQDDEIINLFSNNLLIFIFNYFIFSIFLTRMIIKLSKSFQSKSTRKYYYIISKELDKEQKWFILHPINKEQYMIGDQYDIDSCTKIKIVTKDELFNNNEIQIK